MTNNYTKYTKYVEVTYAGKKLVKEYPLNTYGIWQIKGADTNTDMSVSYYERDLGLVEGKLEDVIYYAVELPNFWGWGSGGSITFVPEIKKITCSDKVSKMREKLLAEQLSLKAALSEVEAKIKLNL